MLSEFSGKGLTSAEVKSSFSRLISAFAPATSGTNAYQACINLDGALERRQMRSRIQDLFSAGSTLSAITDTLLAERDEIVDSGIS